MPAVRTGAERVEDFFIVFFISFMAFWGWADYARRHKDTGDRIVAGIVLSFVGLVLSFIATATW